MSNLPHDNLWTGKVPRETGRSAKSAVIVVVVTLIGFGYWATHAMIDSASVAQGNFIATGKNRVIQHLSGGTISQLNVSVGKKIEVGDVLLRLDTSDAAAELDAISLRAHSLLVKRERLKAEISEVEIFKPSAEMPLGIWQEKEKNSATQVQVALFNVRKRAVETELGILSRGVSAFQEHLEGLRHQQASSEEQLRLLRVDISAQKKLVDKGYARRPELLAMRRSEFGLEGEIARIRSQIADGLERISRGELLVSKASNQYLQRSISELENVERDLQDTLHDMHYAERQLERMTVRATEPGEVVSIEVNTMGGVVKPGAKIMEILPDNGDLVIEAYIRPQDIDGVKLGQTAQVRLTAFNQRTTPLADGEVIYVSADTVADKNQFTGEDIYIAHLAIERESLPDFVAAALSAGMPAEVYIKTGRRTFAEYIMRPLTDSMTRAFKEQ
ncbi:HlyD family type I secretion periplasmic adaptor subunit [Pseudopelagicola sp. nBUS_19]|uniref:HlyD family type I secretion periplasmic adaptor subunit n=1 Tax=unclassified Pseudopelagicola TaxID=2649563 RepID=UPI003EBE6E1E